MTELDKLKKNDKSQKFQIQKLMNENDRLKRDISRLNGIRKYTDNTVSTAPDKAAFTEADMAMIPAENRTSCAQIGLELLLHCLKLWIRNYQRTSPSLPTESSVVILFRAIMHPRPSSKTTPCQRNRLQLWVSRGTKMCQPHCTLNYPSSPRHGHYHGRFQWWRSALRPGILPIGVRTWGPLIIWTRQHGAQLTPHLSPTKLPHTAVTTPSSSVRHW